MEQRRKILVLAYCLSPFRGSEYSVGWNYCRRMSKFYDLTVLYGASGDHLGDTQEMEEFVKNNPNPAIEFIPVHATKAMNRLNFLNRHGIFNYTFYFAYKLWHKEVYRIAKEIIAEKHIDLIHYVCPIGYREPGYLWKLGLPYVWGPIGGTHNTPKVLLNRLSGIARLKHSFRDFSNSLQLLFKLRVRRAINHCDALFACSNEVAEDIAKYFHKHTKVLPENCIEHIYGIPDNKNFTDGPLRVSFVGSLDARKNPKMLLEALLKAKDANVHVDFVGTGPEMKSIIRYAEENGIMDKISMWGKVDREKAVNIISNSHIMVITSIIEGNPTIVWEAMSYGVPIVTLDHCGMSLSVSSQSGWKVPVTTWEEMVGTIAQILKVTSENRNIVAEKSQNTISRAKKFTWDIRQEELIDTYETIWSKRGM